MQAWLGAGSPEASACNFLCLFSSVIVTEKTNILLRYLHQQWDKKVRHVGSGARTCGDCGGQQGGAEWGKDTGDWKTRCLMAALDLARPQGREECFREVRG